MERCCNVRLSGKPLTLAYRDVLVPVLDGVPDLEPGCDEPEPGCGAQEPGCGVQEPGCGAPAGWKDGWPGHGSDGAACPGWPLSCMA